MLDLCASTPRFTSGGQLVESLGYGFPTERLLRATSRVITDCPCATGCPSCVQRPKSGDYNDPLDKSGAVRLIKAALPDEVGVRSSVARCGNHLRLLISSTAM